MNETFEILGSCVCVGFVICNVLHINYVGLFCCEETFVSGLLGFVFNSCHIYFVK